MNTQHASHAPPSRPCRVVYFEQSNPVNQPNRGRHGQNNGFEDWRMDCWQPFPYQIMEGLPVILPQWATANRERQGALTESRTTIAGDPFYREWLCGAGQGCRGRILERLYIDHCLPLTVELFRQLAFFILSCKPISYCRFKRIDVYIL